MLYDLLQNKGVFIFDLDGTLIESLGLWNRVDATLIKNVTGVIVNEREIGRIRDNYLGQVNVENPYVMYVDFLKQKYNMSGSLEDLCNYRKVLINKIINTITLKPYVMETLSLIKRRGFKVCLATVSAKSSVDNIFYNNPNTTFLGNFPFDAILTQKDLKKMKPNPEIHLKLQELLGFTLSDAVIIEDSYIGLMAAKNAGIDCIVVKEELNINQEAIKSNADYYIDSLQELYENMLKTNENKGKMRVLS